MANPRAEDARLDEAAQKSPTGGASRRPTTDRARQGQNIRGMMGVLIGGIVLVTIAYAIMLAVHSKPASVPDSSNPNAAATSGTFPSTPDAAQIQGTRNAEQPPRNEQAQ